MKAIGYHRPGTPDVLEVLDLPAPEPAPGEVLVRVRAAGVNPTDVARRSMGRELDNPPAVPGMDAAGVVEAIGPDTETDLRVGDAVMAIVVPHRTHGAYAELVALPAASVVRTPADASFVEAATLPMNGLTARLALDTLGLEAGATLAVTGAAGAFGGYVVQLAKTDGLTVIADASEVDEALVSSLGADHVVRRGPGFAQAVREIAPNGADGIADGALQLDEIVPAAADGATIVTLRGATGTHERGVRFAPVMVTEYAQERDKLDDLRRLADEGALTLRVAEAMPAEQAARAHERFEAGGVRGRFVLEF